MGTGDGVFAYRMAKAQPDTLVIGLDSNAENLRDISHKASLKPTKGGLQNVMFGQVSLEEAPGELAGLADSVSVILPWGALLGAVARPDLESLLKLAALCKPNAKVTILYGYGLQDQSMITSLGLPALRGQNSDYLQSRFGSSYLASGFKMKFQYVSVETVRDLPSRWAKKLAFSGQDRVFVRIEGHRA